MNVCAQPSVAAISGVALFPEIQCCRNLGPLKLIGHCGMNWRICLLIFVLASDGSSLTGANGGTLVATWGLVVSEPFITYRWERVRCRIGSFIIVRTARGISRGYAAFAGRRAARPVVE